MFKHFLTFKKNNVTVIPIFDGKPPVEKKEERQQRKERKEQNENRIFTLESDLEEYLENGHITELLSETNQSIISKKMNNKLLMKQKLFKNSNSPRIEVESIKDYIDHSKKKGGLLIKKDVEIIKQLFDLIGINYIQADEEAETLGCYLQNKGLVDCIISLDSDCIAYGVDYFIIDMNQAGTCSVFDVNELCALMELEKVQVRDLCIICQCDYNSNGRGLIGIGPAKAELLLKKFNNIETILANGYKEDELNYERCRTIFTTQYEAFEERFREMTWNPIEDIDKLEAFLKDNNIPIFFEDIKSLWNIR